LHSLGVHTRLETIDSLIDWWPVRAITGWQLCAWGSRQLIHWLIDDLCVLRPDDKYVNGVRDDWVVFLFFFFFFFFLGNLENLSLMLTNKIIPPIEEYLKGIISRDTGTVRIPGLTLGIRKLVPTLLWVNGWSPTYK
jgi:hypothetical protein